MSRYSPPSSTVDTSDRQHAILRVVMTDDDLKQATYDVDLNLATGDSSHWRDCHFADAPSPSLLKHLLKVEGGCSRMTVSPMARRQRGWDRLGCEQRLDAHGALRHPQLDDHVYQRRGSRERQDRIRYRRLLRLRHAQRECALAQ